MITGKARSRRRRCQLRQLIHQPSSSPRQAVSGWVGECDGGMEGQREGVRVGEWGWVSGGGVLVGRWEGRRVGWRAWGWVGGLAGVRVGGWVGELEVGGLEGGREGEFVDVRRLGCTHRVGLAVPYA